jgi:hypothetical protein
VAPDGWHFAGAVLSAFGTQASAQVPLHESCYEIVTTQFDQIFRLERVPEIRTNAVDKITVRESRRVR